MYRLLHESLPEGKSWPIVLSLVHTWHFADTPLQHLANLATFIMLSRSSVIGKEDNVLFILESLVSWKQ